jgi:hypothetical protein
MAHGPLSRDALQLLVVAALLVIGIASSARTQELNIQELFRLADTNGEGGSAAPNLR